MINRRFQALWTLKISSTVKCIHRESPRYSKRENKNNILYFCYVFLSKGGNKLVELNYLAIKVWVEISTN